MCKCKTCKRSLDLPADIKLLGYDDGILSIEYDSKGWPAYFKIGDEIGVSVDTAQLDQIIKKLKEIKDFHEKHDS